MKRALIFLLPFSVLAFCAETFPEPSTFSPEKALPQIMVDTFDEAKALADLRDQIKGKENALSGEVFRNIKVLQNVPAGRLLRIMEFGFSRSLGVTCTHCHNPEAWEAEILPVKQVARDMWNMTGRINSEMLGAIPNLQSETPQVNCTTCHRGQVKPALNLN